jgi:hypothetical protein
MVKKHVLALCILALFLATVSCVKLDQPTKPGPLTYETIKFADAIPQDYGPLIGVTENPQSGGWVGLWFQRSDGTIAAVFVNINDGRIFGKALTIPRK